MQIEILTLFPEIFGGFLSSSLIHKAAQKNLVQFSTKQIRDYALGPHRQVDDVPYGGGAGMVMKPEPLVAAVRDAKNRLPGAKVILLSASGNPFTQSKAHQYSKESQLILLCGRYEGVDERVCELVVDEEISIGDYVLMGGEVAAMVVIESVTRLIPGVVGNEDSIEHESFTISGEDFPKLEAPQYTRPPEFEGLKVPEVLLSGNHAKINAWRKEKGAEKTRRNRPDLL